MRSTPLLFCAALLTVACAGGAPPSASAPGAADDLLIVDCLLPGQVRRLGAQATYVTARRATKTTARECALRGGEYVAYDRASRGAALAVWLPAAEQGDREAQTYVGEIYERGLGGEPDPASAALWYRRAAEQGFARAQMNLGSLYERGVGVPKDPVQALEWYRRASGIEGATFGLAAPGSGGDAELQRLRGEVESLRGRLEEKERELERSQEELRGLRQRFEERRGAADAERAELERLRRDLEVAQSRATADADGTAGQEGLARALTEREQELAAQRAEAKALADRLSSLEKHAATEAAHARAEAPGGEEHAELEQLQRKIRESEAERVRLGAELSARERDMEEARRTQAELASQPRPGLDAVLALQAQIQQREKRLAERDREIEDLRTELARVEEEAAAGAVEVAALSGGELASRSQPPVRPGPRVGAPLPAEQVKWGRYHALVIGNDAYRFLPSLRTAANDAKGVARVLEEDYGFHVRLLLDATRYDLLSALNELRQSLTADDNLLLYYAGHGSLDEVNQRGNWLPVDAEPGSTANWVSNVDVTDVLNAMAVRQLLVVADSCYSGTLTRSAVVRIEGGKTPVERLRLIRVMTEQRSRMVLTSGGLEPVLDTLGGQHSLFAQAFLEALGGNAGVLTGQELFQFLLPKVANAAGRVDFRQVPEYAPIKFAGHESGDFFFVRRPS